MCKIHWAAILFLLVAVFCSGCANLAYLRDPDNCQDKSEKLYAELLTKYPYEHVRRAVGRYKGYPHMWVEVWDLGRWWVEDPALGIMDCRHYRAYHYCGWESVVGSGKQ